MTNTIRREIRMPQPREQVWRAITDRATLAEWMFPNDFEPRVGHRFTFQVPGNPKVNFDGLTVQCEVLECEPPRGGAGEDAGGRLVFSWSVAGPVANTRVSFRLTPDGDGTHLFFEHSGFDLTHPYGDQALKGAEFGWTKMLGQLSARVAGSLAAVRTERVLPAPPRAVFAAFERPEQLAQWWGPNGFTSTFETFEFKPGGRWIFVMHGPNGANYPNESVFREISPDTRIVIEHVVHPRFELTITLTRRDDETPGGQTHLAWVQAFESPEIAAKMRALSETANEQVLDRLAALLANEKA